jgi:hypothetical protein
LQTLPSSFSITASLQLHTNYNIITPLQHLHNITLCDIHRTGSSDIIVRKYQGWKKNNQERNQQQNNIICGWRMVNACWTQYATTVFRVLTFISTMPVSSQYIHINSHNRFQAVWLEKVVIVASCRRELMVRGFISVIVSSH